MTLKLSVWIIEENCNMMVEDSLRLLNVVISVGYDRSANVSSVKSSALRSVRSLIRLGKYKSKDYDLEERERLLKDQGGSKSLKMPQTPQSIESESVPESLAGSMTSLESAGVSEQSCAAQEPRKR